MEPPFTTEVPVRFRDLDTMGHVNNAVYATYLEQARVDYFRDVIGEGLHEVNSVLATLSIEYRRPVQLADSVTVSIAVPQLGKSSIPMEYEIRAGGELAATAETVQVAVDPETERSRPIPASWRDRIREFEGL
ncbi:acyl-CoA thioesterase [Haloferacaceae archaeon DSL9]